MVSDPVQRLRGKADDAGPLLRGPPHDLGEPLGATARQAVERRNAEHIHAPGSGHDLLGRIPFGIAQGEFAHERADGGHLVRSPGIDPLPFFGILPGRVVERKLAQLARPDVAVDQYGLRFAGLDDRGMHPLPDIDPDLIGQEVDQRQVAVAIVSQIHREEEKGDGKHDFQGVEGEDLVGAVTPPDHQGHRQQRQVLVESLPRRQLQRLAETTAVLDGDHRSAEQGEGGKKEHGKHGEDRDQADTYLEEEHTAHHHLGTAQPDRKGHARPLEGFHPVDGKILVDLHGGAPRIDDLREARHDERAGKDQPADIGQQFKGPGLPHRLRVLVPAGHIF